MLFGIGSRLPFFLRMINVHNYGHYRDGGDERIVLPFTVERVCRLVSTTRANYPPLEHPLSAVCAVP
jgi:hypothetical protein